VSKHWRQKHWRQSRSAETLYALYNCLSVFTVRHSLHLKWCCCRLYFRSRIKTRGFGIFCCRTDPISHYVYNAKSSILRCKLACKFVKKWFYIQSSVRVQIMFFADIVYTYSNRPIVFISCCYGYYILRESRTTQNVWSRASVCLCVSVCLSVCPRPYAHTTARTRM